MTKRFGLFWAEMLTVKGKRQAMLRKILSKRLFVTKLFFCVLATIPALLLLTACGSEKEVQNNRSSASLSAVTAIASNASESATTATSNPDPDWQYRWLQGIPCKPPCWEGLIPGQTTGEEALNILKQNPLVAVAEISYPGPTTGGNYVGWNWVTAPKNRYGSVGDGGDAVFRGSAHVIDLIRPKYTITFKLSQVIAKYGEPSHVIAIDVTGPDLGSPKEYYLGFVYLPMGFLLYLKTGNIPTLTADIALSGPQFFIPGEDGFRRFGSPPLKVLVPWQGYKDFAFYCRSQFDSGTSPCDFLKKSTP
ncbi:MAG TPA: hypothetical protein VH186_27195 [Chloroflexia bacterium]|nr:hypothetical protein [Chloroflexia bacterium]